MYLAIIREIGHKIIKKVFLSARVVSSSSIIIIVTTLPSSISRTTGPLRATPNGVEGVPSHAVP